MSNYDLTDELFPDDEQAPGDRNGYAAYNDVECVHETAKALVCIIDGKRRPIPKSVVGNDSEVNEKGDKGRLQIRSWFANKMESEEADDESGPVTVADVVVLREARSGKAIEVKLPDGREIWIPVTQIMEASECRYDGDMGKLVVSAWIAKEKGLESK